MTLGQRIAQYRRNLGISQEELGARLDVSRQAVSKWETDAARPDMENLLSLAREFGVSVAELTQTPEETPTAVPAAGKRRQRRLLALILLIAAAPLLYLLVHALPLRTVPPAPTPETDFALLWYGAEQETDCLELGVQDTLFPFGTSLSATEPETVLDTDYPKVQLHQVDCGAMKLEFLRSTQDGETDTVTSLSACSREVWTPRGIHIGSSNAEVLEAYGDALVYCKKEEGGYSLVPHDFYYAYQTAETFGASLCIFLRDGQVVGLRAADMAELGSEAYAPDYVRRFPMKNGQPDFTLRQEPEVEQRSDTWRVYHAFNELVTNQNLSAEERYAYRRDVFGLLSDIDWQEVLSWSSSPQPEDALFALTDWLAGQESYSAFEILHLQMGCTARGLDGAYTDSYAHVLSCAFFFDPVTFAKQLATEGVPADTMRLAIRLTAYDAALYPAAQEAALRTLKEAVDTPSSLTEAESVWAELLFQALTVSA